jgi:hypothetical protein
MHTVHYIALGFLLACMLLAGAKVLHMAVVRLMTSSNLVGCWTGRLAGLSPLSTRST